MCADSLKDKIDTMQNMSEPIDFIDLTVDSPKEDRLKIRKERAKNRANNRRILTIRRSPKQNKSVIDISIGGTCKDVETMEIIDLDSINLPERSGMCDDNNSTQENQLMLTCPICFEQISSKMKPMSTCCGHIFCAQCIKQALRITKKCPICKRTTKFQSCIRLHI